MAELDIKDFMELGARIMKLGAELKDQKEMRDQAVEAINKIEAELRPLIVQHSAHISALVGVPSPAVPAVSSPAPALEATGPALPPVRPGTTGMDMARAKELVRGYLDRLEGSADPDGDGEKIGVPEIAQALQLDMSVVRAVMHGFAMGGR